MALKKCALFKTGKNGLPEISYGILDTDSFRESEEIIRRAMGTGKGLHHPPFRQLVVVHVISGYVDFSFAKSPDATYPEGYETVRIGEGQTCSWIIFDDQEPTPSVDNSGHRSDVPTNAVQTATVLGRGEDGSMLNLFFTPDAPAAPASEAPEPES